MDPENAPEITPELLEANPLLAAVLALFSLLVIIGLAGSLSSWALVIVRLAKRQPILDSLPWRPRAWGLSEILLAICVLMASQVLLIALAVPLLGLDREALAAGESPPMSLAAVMSIGYLLTVLVLGAWILLRFRVTLEHIGFKSTQLFSQIRIGVVTGLMVVPLTMLISGLVNIGFQEEYDHPLLTGMAEEATLSGFLLAAFAAVLVAPFAEEFLFRVLLQGWLQSIPFKDLPSLIRGGTSSAPGSLWGLPSTQPPASVMQRAAEAAAPANQATIESAYQPPAETLNTPASDSSDQDIESQSPSYVPPIWPSIVAGTLFGLAHWGYGLSFIPLTFLGISMGLLYRATQSVWPCVIVHFMLNATSMTALGVGIYMQRVAA